MKFSYKYEWSIVEIKSLTFPSGRAPFYVSQRGWGELGKRLVIGIPRGSSLACVASVSRYNSTGNACYALLEAHQYAKERHVKLTEPVAN